MGERPDRRQWREKGGERVAAVDKIEEKRKPEDFIGHRNRGSEATQIRKLPAACHNTTTWSAQKVTSAKAEVTNAAI